MPGTSLVPENDQSLLFTNSGMVQYKDVFLGIRKPDSPRAVTIQKCIRAGGKHNDLSSVGYSARHHTFFEMLGNFSFGDYFKLEAIQFAWEFLTNIIHLPKERLWVTVFREDTESHRIWLKEIGISPTHLSKEGSKNNFWSMGKTGPCGPCTEIFYNYDPGLSGEHLGIIGQKEDCCVEIWNLVFMQHNRLTDGTLESLPQVAVDTGMGLERLATILQGVKNNYEIDVFQQLIKFSADIIKIQNLSHPSLRVIVDHIRASSFLIADGIIPSNEGRGYVLRRIIRRAIRHGYKLGTTKIFFYKLADELVSTMELAYPELQKKQLFIKNVLKTEEIQFQETLSHGIKIFNKKTKKLKDKTISGSLAFKLYDTYGLPLDFIKELAKRQNMIVNAEGFNNVMVLQKMRAKNANSFSFSKPVFDPDQVTSFLGYTTLSSYAVITKIYFENKPAFEVFVNNKAILTLDQTPFYGESGGQVGDIGEIIISGEALFQVLNTHKVNNSILHIGQVVKGQYRLGDRVETMVNTNNRSMIAANHSATHLLHSALRQIIGKHVEQKGSLVEANRLRFDFLHNSKLTSIEIQGIEVLVNQIIRQNISVEYIETTPSLAKKMGALALFGEKYGTSKVQALKIGNFSIELCGGTHVKKTSEIGLFKITNQYAIAAGIRRVEALTGKLAEAYINHQEKQLLDINILLKSNSNNVLDKVLKLQAKLKAQKEIIKNLKQQIISRNNLKIQSTEIAGITIISSILRDLDIKLLRTKIDQYKSNKTKVIVSFATICSGRAIIAVGISLSVTNKIHAGELANFICKQIGGKGGGRPDMAQGGGNPEGLPLAMESVYDWVKRKLYLSHNNKIDV